MCPCALCSRATLGPRLGVLKCCPFSGRRGACVLWRLLEGPTWKSCVHLPGGSLGRLHGTCENKGNKHCLLVACSELGREARPCTEDAWGRGACMLSAEGTAAEK